MALQDWITLCASLEAQCNCNRSCLFVGLWLCLFVCGSVTKIDPHQTGFVYKGSDHLQLIRFWPSRVPGKGSARGEIFWKIENLKFFCLTTTIAQCLRLSGRFSPIKTELLLL